MFTLFEEIGSPAEKRRRVVEEKERVQEALNKVTTDRKDLEKLAARPFDSSFYPKLRRLEGADFNSPFNFVWRLDFPNIFADKSQIKNPKSKMESGFDLIVGNPPFVTARNPVKRELYRERWKRVCSGTYMLICPFFDLSFGLLKTGGQLGFIVSNAFAKREFGKPLVEDFFPTVDLQKVIDCSGLMFPGHGTPTCIVFGRNQKPDPRSPIRVAAILPGGGDLRTPPEESPLWQTLAERHDRPGYSDARVVVANHPRTEAPKWPWDFQKQESHDLASFAATSTRVLGDFTDEPIGHVAITRTDDVFLLPEHLARRCQIELRHLRRIGTGEAIRNWMPLDYSLIMFPYQDDLSSLDPRRSPRCVDHLRPFRSTLENVVMHGSVRKKETNVQWFEYSRLARPKFRARRSLALPEIATHNHALVDEGSALFHQTVPVIKLAPSASASAHHLLAALLNSSSALFWLKQVCFSKRESEEGATDTYFVFAGGKVHQLPVPAAAAQALQGNASRLAPEGCALALQLTDLSRKCWEHGQRLPSLTMRKLFDKPGEAYHEWNASLPGHVAPHAEIAAPFDTAADLRAVFARAVEIREALRAEMIALQEEMDWLVYEAYGLIAPPCHSERSEESRRCRPERSEGSQILRCAQNDKPAQLAREERPFCLWAQAQNDFDRAVALIPSDWSDERKVVWTARLQTIRDNEHIRRIEQPVYKRRWDEQWKVGGRWQCGQPAYDAEFLDAFHWWLSEKAEWWLEHERSGGPVTLDEWTSALWSDPGAFVESRRVQAAWEVVVEVTNRLEEWRAEQRAADTTPMTIAPNPAAFARYFKSLVKDQTVPADLPFAVPWEELEKTRTVPASAKRIRGKLNVPRERFRVTAEGEYVWAGKAQP